jgi:hypothetical protein
MSRTKILLPQASRWLLDYLALSLPDEGYSRSTSYASDLIFTFLLRWDDDDVRFLIDQDAELDFCNASSLKQQSECRHVAPFWHIILILSQPIFVVSPECRVWLAENQEIAILYLLSYPTGARSHNLPNSMRSR